jgi:hypothetical protein
MKKETFYGIPKLDIANRKTTQSYSVGRTAAGSYS